MPKSNFLHLKTKCHFREFLLVFFDSFGLSAKEPYTIMLCPSLLLASSCISIGISVCAHLPLAHG